MPRFAHAYRRIYAPLETHWDGQWTLVVAAGLDAPERAHLRKELLWEGYAMLAPGVFGHPAAEALVLEDIVKRVGVQGKLFAASACALPQVSGRALADVIAEGWDLSGVLDGYKRFIDVFSPLLALVEGGTPLAPEQAYVVRTLLIHAYRRVQLHDPMLPVELLPQPWPGAGAYALARAIYRATYAQAEAHLMAALQREDAHAPKADPSFYERFGGLA